MTTAEHRTGLQRLIAFVCVFVLVWLTSTPVAAQDDAEEPVREPDTDLVIDSISRDRETGLVTAEVIVPVDLAGEPLPADAVTVLDGVRRIDYTYAPIPADQLEIVLVLDVSGSMAGAPLEAAKAAATSFINLLPDGVNVATVAFDDEVSVGTELTTSGASAIESINAFQVGGDTALFDAMITASTLFDQPDARRVVVALTDGGDSASVQSLDDARAALKDESIEAFAVALATNESATETLEELVAGIGELERAASIDGLSALYNDLATELANRFTVTFTPGGNDPGSVLMLLSANGVLAGAELEFGRASVAVPDAAGEARQSSAVLSLDQNVRTQTIPEVTLLEEPGTVETWMRSSWGRNVGIAALGMTLFVIGLFLSFPSERMTALAERGKVNAQSVQVTDLKGRLENSADSFLRRTGRERRLSSALERAGMSLRPAEFVVLAGAIALVAGMLAFLRWGLIAALVVMGVVVLLARLRVSRAAHARSKKFVEQLPSTLQLIAGALRAGYALPQAIEHVANETEAPTADEFHRLSTEVRLGRDLSDALHAMDARLDAEDFTWVVQAIDIHREVGGDLAEVLDRVHDTMRDRNFVRRQVSAVSAEGRYSAYLITSLPFVVALIMTFTNPQYIGRLVEDTKGWLVLMTAAGLITVGSFWMRQLVKVKY